MSEQIQNIPLESLAAIDIGSNSIRMTIGQLLSDGRIEILEKAQRAVRLGQDTFRLSRLEPATMRAAILILREFKRRLDEYQIKNVWTVATSAVREARNADVFLDRVLMASGLEINIIDASMERRLTVSAVRSAVHESGIDIGQQTLICEVGGGSTMMTVLRRGKLITSQSLGLGSVRLQEVLGTFGKAAGQVHELIENEIDSVLASVEGLMPLGRVKTFFAIGGDARFAARRVGKKVNNTSFHTISRSDFESLVEWIKGLSVEKLVSKTDISYPEAETLPSAMMIFEALLRSTHAKELVVPEVSMRDGLLLEMSRRYLGQQDQSAAQEVIDSATVLAEKYRVNLHHAKRVAACALHLFDELKSLHGMGPRHRLLLEVASLLHETGTFVSTRAYHKHTYYLVVNSEIFGLTRNEVATVAHVARYHRRSGPKPSHLEYMSLSQEMRILVNKLAALLRLAKALDITDTEQLDRLRCVIEQDCLKIIIPGMSQDSLSMRSVEVRSSLFEDVYGVNLEIE